MNLFYDKERKLLVYDLPEPEAVLRHVPNSIKLNNGYVCVHDDLHSLQLLTWLGYPVIPPMRADTYDWPIRLGRRPREHQIVQANFMALNPRCFNLSDMGTQKTLSALWAMDFIMLYHQGLGLACRALIGAPLSTLQRVWADTLFADFLGKRTWQIVHADAPKRRQQLAANVDFYLINHDGIQLNAKQETKASRRKTFTLAGLSKDIADREDIRIVNIDEASAYRAANTKRSRVAFMNIATKPYLCLMTGTPTPNGPLDAYGLAKLVNNARGESFTSYRSRVTIQFGPWTRKPVRGSHKLARELLTPAIRYELKDCWDAPPHTATPLDVELTPEQDKAYREIKRQAAILLESERKITAANEAALRLKLIQIACGAVYDDKHEPIYYPVEPRMQAVKDVLEWSGRKIVCFAPFTSVIQLLYDRFKDEYPCAIVNGTRTTKENDATVLAFQTQDEPWIIFAHPGSLAHGHDLFAANITLWYSPPDRTEFYLQGERRVRRPGQEHPTTSIQLAGCGPEREIYRRLEANESLQGIMLDLVRRGL